VAQPGRGRGSTIDFVAAGAGLHKWRVGPLARMLYWATIVITARAELPFWGSATGEAADAHRLEPLACDE